MIIRSNPKNQLVSSSRVQCEEINDMEDDKWIEAKKRFTNEKCQLDGQLVFLLSMKSEDPCAGCNLDRKECGGREKSERNSWGGPKP